MVQMNLFTKQKYSHSCRKQTYGYQGGKEGRDKLGDWDWHIHTTIYKIITNKDLLYSTGNSTQYSVMAYMRKESKNEWIYEYV